MLKHRIFSFCILLALCFSAAFAQTRGLPDFTELVEKQGGTVVNISTTQVTRAAQVSPFMDESDPAFEFFKRFFPRVPGGAVPREFENKSLGSGFLISADGFILTNAHVVDGADEVTVRLTDKREFKAKIIGSDKRTDVALIKIEATGLPFVKIAEMSQLKVGEWVVAIGSPFGFDNSVTAGIVSAKGRSLPQENYVPFIQTDVAINPGNSGGPLFNLRGEVVGINSQIYSRSGGYMGVSFAIPIDVALDIQQQLRAHGKVSRGRLGVVIQEVSKDLADSLGLAKPSGAIVTSVEKASPAEKASLEAGDVILKFDGKSVLTSSDLPRMVAASRPGTKVMLQIWRKGQVRDLALTVGEAPEEKLAVNKPRAEKGKELAANRLGLVLADLTTGQKRELKLDSGVLVEEVRGANGRGEIRAGDVLLALISKGMTTEIKSVEQFNRLVSQLEKGANLTLLVRRGEMQTFVTLKGI